jgi:acyl carrier protein
MSADTFAALRRIAADLFGVRPDVFLFARTLLDAGIDSLSAADLIVRIESHFGISVTVEDLFNVHSLRDLSAVVDRLITRRTHCYDE